MDVLRISIFKHDAATPCHDEVSSGCHDTYGVTTAHVLQQVSHRERVFSCKTVYFSRACRSICQCPHPSTRRIRVSPVPISKCQHVVLGLFKKLSLLAFAMKSQGTHTSSLRASWKASRSPLFTCATRSKLSEALFVCLNDCLQHIKRQCAVPCPDMVELYRSIYTLECICKML